jgi:GT2 family glycosyltransferase
MDNYPSLATIILNWNGWQDTIECLESLKKITYPNYEMIVVDNGSDGNDADALEKNQEELETFLLLTLINDISKNKPFGGFNNDFKSKNEN